MAMKRPRAYIFNAAGLLSILAMLAACQEREEILPGKRESVSAVLQGAPRADESRAEPIALPAQSANADASHGIGTPRYRTTHPALNADPRLAWSVRIGAGDSRRQRIVADPVVADGLIFTLDSGSLVSAVTTEGALVWQRDLRPARDNEGDATGGGLAVEGDTLYVALGYGALTAVDAKSGETRWTQQLDATGSGRPTVYGGLIYISVGDQSGWALDKKTGRIVWQIGAVEDVSNVLGAPAPALTDELAIFGFGSGELQAVFRQGGLRRWDASVLGERPGRALNQLDDVTGAPVIDRGVVYAGNQSGRMVAVDIETGLRLWTADEGTVGAMYPIGGSIFALTDRNNLVRLDAANGEQIWTVPLPNYLRTRPRRIAAIHAHHGPVVAGGYVRVTSSDGLLRSFDPRDGSLAAETEIPGGASTGPIVAGQTLYVVGRSGQLHAFR